MDLRANSAAANTAAADTAAPVRAVVPLSATQQHVLETLMQHGEATVEDLAKTLDISGSAVRQHLAALRSADLVSARLERGRPGRPVGHYRATQRAEPLFVAPDAALSLEILELIEEESPVLIQNLFDRRRRKLVDSAAGDLCNMTLAERVEAVTELLISQGYHADFEVLDPAHYRINLHSCAIWSIASHYRQACASELAFITDLMPGATVERVTHKTAGAHTCAYDINAST